MVTVRRPIDLSNKLSELGIEAIKTYRKQHWKLNRNRAFAYFNFFVKTNRFGIQIGTLSFDGDSDLVKSSMDDFISYYERYCRREKIHVYCVHSVFGSLAKKEDPYFADLPKHLLQLGFNPWSEFNYKGIPLKNITEGFNSGLDRLKMTHMGKLEELMEMRLAYEALFREKKAQDKTFTFHHSHYANLWVDTRCYLEGYSFHVKLDFDRSGQLQFRDDKGRHFAVSTLGEIKEVLSRTFKQIENVRRIPNLYSPPRHHFYSFIETYITNSPPLLAQIDRFFLQHYSERRLEEMLADDREKPQCFIYKATDDIKIRRVVFLNHILVVGHAKVHFFNKESAHLAGAAFEEEVMNAIRYSIKDQHQISL
jgi:hypothetical protein